MEHGGDLISYEGYYDGALTDYSSNINPLGPPSGLEQILIDGFKNLEAYPDIQYRKLKKAIANYLNCHKDNVIVGNGAVEIIDNFIIQAKRVLVCTPSFSEYEKRAMVHGKDLIRIPYNPDFTIDAVSLRNEIGEGDLLILGNPNNPTGLRIDKIELIMLYDLVKKTDACLLLDEAFFEFCPMDYDTIELFRQTKYENLGIIRAATKFFALPGIRLGYGCTSISLAEKISKIELPWRINSLAESAGNFIFNDKKYIEESKAYIEEERRFVLKELKKLSYIKAYHTDTNYILIKLLKWSEEYIFNFFLKKGIVIRKGSSFIGLDQTYIRVAVKDRENNRRLIEIFKELECI